MKDSLVLRKIYANVMHNIAAYCSLLLGRIVVARDLDAATQIAKRYHYRFRIVTLDGQVVNAGGSMTGGSQARSAGLLSRSADIAQGKEKIAALEQQAAKAKETFQATAQRTIKAEQAIEHAKNMLYQRQGRDCTDTSGV